LIEKKAVHRGLVWWDRFSGQNIRETGNIRGMEHHETLVLMGEL